MANNTSGNARSEPVLILETWSVHGHGLNGLNVKAVGAEF